MKLNLKHNRRAFTITEMLVATALLLAIMAIIAMAYSRSLQTFSKLRSVSVLQDRLRAASQTMKRDLSAEHFDGPFIAGFSGPYLGDQRLDRAGWVPPKGYFQVRQVNVPILEAADGLQLPSTTASGAQGHHFSMTVKIPSNVSTDLFSAQAPATGTAYGNAIFSASTFPSNGIYYSRWAEVSYYLKPTAETAGTTQLYVLCRRQRLLAQNSVLLSNCPATLATDYPDLSLTDIGPGAAAGTRNFRLNSPEDVSKPHNRIDQFIGGQWRPADLTGVREGDEILLPDVISMEVKIGWVNNSAFGSWSPGVPGFNLTTEADFPFSNVPATPSFANNGSFWNGQRVFDTWYRHNEGVPAGYPTANADAPGSANYVDWDNQTSFLAGGLNRPPVRINVRGIQIKIRVWDPKGGQARQITIVQEL